MSDDRAQADARDGGAAHGASDEDVHREVLARGLARMTADVHPAEAQALFAASRAHLSFERHGDLRNWFNAFTRLQTSPIEDVDLTLPAVRIGNESSLPTDERRRVESRLRCFLPWRKGPFDVFGVHVDSEWQSNLKWARIEGAIDVRGKRVLDVGCGNGYYALRAIGAGARSVLGVDPSLLFVMQFAVINGWANASACVLPLRFEELPRLDPFDTVLSLGVLGHRKNPEAHLSELRTQLKRGGHLVLETLVLPGEGQAVFEPAGRYAAMRNVYRLPTVETLLGWVRETGFADAELIDVSRTTPVEQRSTEWMPSQSLADFLDPTDPLRTREGHPAPTRAVVIARH